MAQKRTIKDRIAAGDDIFIVTDLGGGKIKLTPAPETVAEAGTDINAALMQPIEDARAEFEEIKSDLMRRSAQSAKTDAMTLPCGMAADGRMYGPEAVAGGLASVPDTPALIFAVTLGEAVSSVNITADSAGNTFSLRRWELGVYVPASATPQDIRSWQLHGAEWGAIGYTYFGSNAISNAASHGVLYYAGDTQSGVAYAIASGSDSDNSTILHIVRNVDTLPPLTAVHIDGSVLPAGTKITLRGVIS